MPKWNNIARLSEQQEKAREAAFEAQMLALIAAPTDNSNTPLPKPTPIHPAASPRPDTVPVSDAIHITVIANGHTTHYPHLLAVPTHLRQHILNTWLTAPTPISPNTVATPVSLPHHPASSAPCPLTPDSLPQSSSLKPRSLRLAITLNLLLPGAGQIYLRQPLLGAAYAIPFLATLIAILTIFIRGYHQYLVLSTNGDLLDPGNLETLAHAFPMATISTLSIIGTALFLVSTIHLILNRRRPS